MMTVAILVAALGEIQWGSQWVTACEVRQSGLAMPYDTDASLWLWAPGDGKAALKVDGKPVAVEHPAKKQDKYVWQRAGRMTFKKGTYALELGEGVAMLVVAQAEAYDPARVMANTCALTAPGSAEDARLRRVRDTNTVFTMPEYTSRAEWEGVAARLRARILLGCGLVPMPDKTPLNAVISGRIEHPGPDGYSVEKVQFEARPGLLVTGNLYRPLGKTGPFPGVINPHGHWPDGRFANEERGCVPARCITLAKMGIVAFTYDMTGYNDSRQLPHGWGTDQEKLWGLHPFGVQLWASIRALDFLEELPDVDRARLACTGASGGGTQTFALMAVDPRVKVAAPVNMISHSMQGGCLCENAPIIRLENSNMEIGALMVPRPLLMVSASGDWTRETPRVEFPAIQSIYRLYDAAGNVENVHVDADHNYNKASREAMYRFFGKHLLGGDPAKWASFEEPPFEVDPLPALRVFSDYTEVRAAPEGTAVDALLAGIVEQTKAKWAKIVPHTQEELAAFKGQYRDVLALTLGTSLPTTNDFCSERFRYEEDRANNRVVEGWMLRRKTEGDGVPALLFRAYDTKPQDAVVLTSEGGKRDFANGVNDALNPLVESLLAQGKAVLLIDVFLQGEHNSPYAPAKRASGQFADTFLPTDAGYRVQDVLTSLAWLRSRRDMTGHVSVAGFGEAGLWTLFAAAIDGRVERVAVSAGQFDPDDDRRWVKKFYIPCIRAIGDIDTAAAMLAPTPLLVADAPDTFRDGIANAYAAAGVPDAAKLQAEEIAREELAAWLK